MGLHFLVLLLQIEGGVSLFFLFRYFSRFVLGLFNIKFLCGCLGASIMLFMVMLVRSFLKFEVFFPFALSRTLVYLLQSNCVWQET